MGLTSTLAKTPGLEEQISTNSSENKHYHEKAILKILNVELSSQTFINVSKMDVKSVQLSQES